MSFKCRASQCSELGTRSSTSPDVVKKELLNWLLHDPQEEGMCSCLKSGVYNLTSVGKFSYLIMAESKLCMEMRKFLSSVHTELPQS